MSNNSLIKEAARSKMLAGVISHNQYKEIIKESNVSSSDFEIYHNTLSEALSEVEEFLSKKGYEINDEQLFQFGVGGITYGQTKRNSFELNRNGEPAKNLLHVQIYRMDSGKYELNMYYDSSRSIKETMGSDMPEELSKDLPIEVVVDMINNGSEDIEDIWTPSRESSFVIKFKNGHQQDVFYNDYFGVICQRGGINHSSES
jgi:hypothetical protein